MVRIAIILAAFVILVAGAVWLFLASEQAAAVTGKTTFSIVGLGILYVLSQMVFPEATKLFVAWLLRKLKVLPHVLKQRVISSEIEANLVKAVKEYGAEGGGMLPYKPKVVWVSSEMNPTSFRLGNKIIIKYDYSDDPHRNIVEAALLYCRTGLIPEARKYLWASLRRALDLVFVKAILERNHLDDGLLYFVQDVLERELHKSPNVEEDYNRLHILHDRGVFTRILLPELRDYAGKVQHADTGRQHEAWIKNFIDFLEAATREYPPGTKKWMLDHIRKRFRVSVIIVGVPRKLAYQGQKPYLKAIATCATNGARVVLIIGTSGAIPDIVQRALKLGIADSKDCQSYHAMWRGEVTQMWCARLQISEQTGACAINRIADIKDWPEVDATLEVDEGRPLVAGD